MRYEFAKQSIILSSRTVFIFSTQRGSIGPSNIIQFLSFPSMDAHFLIIEEANPSYHS